MASENDNDKELNSRLLLSEVLLEERIVQGLVDYEEEYLELKSETISKRNKYATEKLKEIRELKESIESGKVEGVKKADKTISIEGVEKQTDQLHDKKSKDQINYEKDEKLSHLDKKWAEEIYRKQRESRRKRVEAEAEQSKNKLEDISEKYVEVEKVRDRIINLTLVDLLFGDGLTEVHKIPDEYEKENERHEYEKENERHELVFLKNLHNELREKIAKLKTANTKDTNKKIEEYKDIVRFVCKNNYAIDKKEQLINQIASLFVKYEIKKQDPSLRKREFKEIVSAIFNERTKGKEPANADEGENTEQDEPTNEQDISYEWAINSAIKCSPSALCFSGGGIRSATFNLGILQGLARHGLLDKFDYLSTVSGGGWAGGWLSAWISRMGIPEVMKQLTQPPENPLDPEPRTIKYLRGYSRFLTPRPGLLSADTWTLVATVLRNLLMNWLVFLPFIFAALILPRVWFTLINREWTLISSENILFWVGSMFLIIALSFVGWYIPSTQYRFERSADGEKETRQSPFIWGCLVPFIISAALLSTYWYRKSDRQNATVRYFVLWSIAIIILPWVLAAVIRFISEKKRNAESGNPKSDGELLRNYLGKVIIASILVIISQAVSGLILYTVATRLPERFVAGKSAADMVTSGQMYYAVFGVPVALLLFALSCTIIAGLTSRMTKDDDQEWWARASGWILIASLIWGVGTFLVLFGPKFFIEAVQNPFSDWKNWGALAFAVISGAVSILGGLSSKTPATPDEAKKAGLGSRIVSILTLLLAPVFLFFLIVLFSAATNWLVYSVKVSVDRAENYLCKENGETDKNKISQCVEKVCKDWSITCYLNVKEMDPLKHDQLLQKTPFRYLVFLFMVLLLLGFIVGRFINTNRFSLHSMWRDRLVMTYLGASRQQRNPNFFTGFDTFDNVYMKELSPQPFTVPSNVQRAGDVMYEEAIGKKKLFHVVNIALNLSNPSRLELQDRKSTTFTVSPLHSGNYILGYRRSSQYGGEEGISLGTAMAISGAFVSPNMGYMTLSPVIRFLMTLFNVRFGWWLGNPGRYGEKQRWYEDTLETIERPFTKSLSPFQMKAPRLSVITVMKEAAGQTNDKYPYVYLSDGGHFENLGLYEMVLRRCRFIVVCDGTTDPNYDFQSLAMSIRQIRVDFGIPIEFQDFNINSPNENFKGKHCAVGKIRYSAVDNDTPGINDDDYDGTLIFIKASVIGGESRDVINYQKGSKDFPNEAIVDHWFSEAQFESYRALGSHIIDAICSDENETVRENDRTQVNLPKFLRKAKDHNRINYRVFQNEINYAAYQQEFSDQIKSVAMASTLRYFRRKVKNEIRRILK